MNVFCLVFSYYHSEYKRVQVAVPHVVNHYAAGARLIGLTEKQIKEHLQKLKTKNAGMFFIYQHIFSISQEPFNNCPKFL